MGSKIGDLLKPGYAGMVADAITGHRVTPEEAGVEIPPPPDVKRPRIPDRFLNARFKNFRRENPAQEAGYQAAADFCMKVAENTPSMLALIGPPGVGKSHLLYSAAHVLYHRGLTVYANPWYKLADELRWGRPGWEARDVLDELYQQKIVLIDEVRPTANTAFDDTALAKFACHAYDNNVSVIITTNVNPLDLVMGPAAADRFTKIIINTESQR